MSLPLPKKVKVGPHTISICFTDNIPGMSSSVLGVYDSTLCTIHISTQQPMSMQTDALLHEILHAIHYLSLGILLGSADIDMQEEQVTTLTATALCQVMKDNPKLFDWIREQLK